MRDSCICCGEIIPEGRQVCLTCETEILPKSTPQKLPSKISCIAGIKNIFNISEKLKGEKNG